MSTEKPNVDIRALAALARVDLSDAEITALEKDIPNILGFVDSIQGVDVTGVSSDTSLRNVMRADENPHEGGLYSEALLSAAPSRVGDRISVKQVITRKNN